MNLVQELRWRGMIHDLTPGTEEQLLKETTSGYVGFDPTADSLHIGNLVPIMLDNTPKFPYLKDRSIYFFVAMTNKDKPQKIRHALVEIPTDTVSRFFVLPKENKYIILLDDIIRYCLDDIFFNFEYDSIQAYTIKITRDAELDIEQDVTKSLVKKVAESIKRRKTGTPVRLTYDESMPAELLTFILKRIKFSKEDHPVPGGRYHNFIDFIRFPSLNKPELK